MIDFENMTIEELEEFIQNMKISSQCQQAYKERLEKVLEQKKINEGVN